MKPFKRLGLRAQLLALLRESYPGHLEQARAGLAGSDARAVERAAHALKGSVGNFGALEACDLAEELETLGREHNLAGAARIFPNLEAAVRRLDQALEAVLQEAED